MKYIDAEKLITLIDTKLEDLGMSGSVWVGRSVLQELKDEITNILLQEQQKADLEEEMQEEYYKYAIYESGSISGEGYQLEAQGHYECNLTRKEFKDIARHFYELGLNTKKEE